MSNIRQRIACKALIQHGSEILILREAKSYKDGTNVGRYHLPGGRIEPGEHFMDGLKREVKEETGLEITVEKPLYVGEWRPVIRGEENQIIAIFFICRAKNKTITLSEEHDEYRWIDPRSYDEIDLMKPEDKVIEAYIAEYC
jgi:8-oxo-dGTP diphosphatase